MEYTVNYLAKLSGVSTRTLRYYSPAFNREQALKFW